jgi:dipeptidyl aminopeptidase/acylaminoacyl peptidase
MSPASITKSAIVTRQRFTLRRGAAVLAVAAGLALLGPVADASPSRQDIVEAFLADRDFGMVRASPDGAFLVVEVLRPVTSPKRMGDNPTARADLWLVTVASGETRQLTSGATDGSAAWAAIWAPDSRKFAYLKTPADGLPQAAWMDVTNGRHGLLSQFAIDIEVNFGSRSPFFGDGHVWGAWTGNDRFITAVAPEDETPYHFRVGAPALVGAPKWARTRESQRSVTVWDSETKDYCSTDTRLLSLRLGGDTQAETLLTGSIRAVTLSPDRRRAAIVLATGAREPPLLGVVDPEFNFYNLDSRVHTQLSLLDLAARSSIQPASTSRGYGFLSDDDAPRWTADSTRLYAPRYERTDGPPSNPCVDPVSSERGAPKIDCALIRSRRHSELLALSLSVAPASSARALADRIRETATAVDLSAQPFGGDISLFRLGHDHVGIAGSGTVRLVDLRTGATVDRVTLAGVTVLLSGALTSDAQSAVLQAGSSIKRLRATADRLSLTDINRPDPSLKPLGIASDGETIVWTEKTPLRQALWLSKGDGDWRRLMTFERPLAEDILAFQKKAFAYRLPDGKTAFAALLLPPGYDASKPYPLIIDVYPFRNFSEQTGARAFDASQSAHADVYALAREGYVVARPSLPNFTGAISDYDPLPYYADLIENFASQAIAAKLTSSGQVGVWGHSNGGYIGLAVSARTKLVNAVMASSPFPDLITASEQPFPTSAFDACAPNRAYANAITFTEDPNRPFWRIGAPTYAALDRYIRNSPIYNMGPNGPATLILEGQFDSQGTANSERVYMRLARQHVPVQLARYWGEAHVFTSAGNIRDKIDRQIAWFNKHLRRDPEGPVSPPDSDPTAQPRTLTK